MPSRKDVWHLDEVVISIGGRARVDEYTGRNWPLADAGYVKERMTPAWPKGWTEERLFPFTTVDGGLINNEPFEFARYCLMEEPGSGEDADRAVTRVLL